MALPLLPIMIGMTALKMYSDAQKEKSDKKVRAAETRFSPWTKLTPSTQVRYADPGGALMQGGMGYMMMDQNAQNQEAQALMNAQQMGLMQKQMDYYDRGGTPLPAAPLAATPTYTPPPQVGGYWDQPYQMGPWSGVRRG